jgi:hypothetical protein
MAAFSVVAHNSVSKAYSAPVAERISWTGIINAPIHPGITFGGADSSGRLVIGAK